MRSLPPPLNTCYHVQVVRPYLEGFFCWTEAKDYGRLLKNHVPIYVYMRGDKMAVTILNELKGIDHPIPWTDNRTAWSVVEKKWHERGPTTVLVVDIKTGERIAYETEPFDQETKKCHRRAEHQAHMWEEYAPSRLSPIANPTGIYVVGRDGNDDVAITPVPTTAIKGYSMRKFPKDTLMAAGPDRCFSYPNGLILMRVKYQKGLCVPHTDPESFTIMEIKRGLDITNILDIHEVTFPIPPKKQHAPDDGIVFDATSCMPYDSPWESRLMRSMKLPMGVSAHDHMGIVGAKGRVVFITGFTNDGSYVMCVDLATRRTSAVTHKGKHNGGDTMGVVLGCIDM
jgi:hypothetical protein